MTTETRGRKPRSATAPARTMIAFRLDVDQLAEIDKRAKEFRMSRTDYLIAAALDNLASARDEMRTWRDEVERRLKSLERMADLGGMG